MLHQPKFTLLKVVFPLLLCLIAATAHAQIFETMHADIHHQFVVGNTTLPAGRYTLQVMPRSGQSLLMISSADGKTQAEVLVRSSVADETPRNTELVFTPGIDTQSLRYIYSAGNKYGLTVLQPSRSEQLLQSRLRNPALQGAQPPAAPTSAPTDTTVGR